MIIAALKDNKVKELVDTVDERVISDLIKKYDQIVDVTNWPIKPQVGWILDGNKLINEKVTSLNVTNRAFNSWFTVAEKTNILAESKKDVSVGLFQDLLTVRKYVDIKSDEFKDRVSYLVSKGLLSSVRANEILTKKPLMYELYRE